MAGISQSGSPGSFASLVNGGITWTADRMGTEGNAISIAIVAGGTAGAEVVSVSGNAISVQIQSGVSTRTQVETAVNASVAASALISISVTSGGTAASLLAATNLAGGVDTVFSSNSNSISLDQTSAGVYEISIPDAYAALLSAQIMIQKASAADLQPQLASVDVSSAKKISFRLLAGATPTSLASGDVLYIELVLRNSSQSQ